MLKKKGWEKLMAEDELKFLETSDKDRKGRIKRMGVEYF